MEVADSEDHDCMVFTVSPSTSSSDFSVIIKEPFTIACDDSSKASETNNVDIEVKTPYAICQVYSETAKITDAVAWVASRTFSQSVEACTQLDVLCQKHNQVHRSAKHVHEKNNTDANNLKHSATFFTHSTSKHNFLPERTRKDENDIKEQVIKLQESLRDIRDSNLKKRKQMFWHALKNYQLAKLNWEGQVTILAKCISLVSVRARNSSAILDLAKHFILLKIKTKTMQLLHKVQKNAMKYSRVDDEMVQHFKRYCSGEVCRRLVELWRDETFAEERISWLTWNLKKASYINNGDKFAHFLYGLKEPTKYSRSGMQESSLQDMTCGGKGVDAESITRESDRVYYT